MDYHEECYQEKKKSSHCSCRYTERINKILRISPKKKKKKNEHILNKHIDSLLHLIHHCSMHYQINFDKSTKHEI